MSLKGPSLDIALYRYELRLSLDASSCRLSGSQPQIHILLKIMEAASQWMWAWDLPYSYKIPATLTLG
jgi:hypothetical protein